MVDAAVLETVACNGRIGSTPIILTSTDSVERQFMNCLYNCLDGENGKHIGFKP